MNTPNELAYIHRTLGELVASMKGISEGMVRDRDEAKDHREKLSEKIDGLVGRIEDIDDRIIAIEKRSVATASKLNDEVMPTVRKINIWEQRGVGFLAFAGIAGTGMGAALMKYSGEIKMAFVEFFK